MFAFLSFTRLYPELNNCRPGNAQSWTETGKRPCQRCHKRMDRDVIEVGVAKPCVDPVGLDRHHPHLAFQSVQYSTQKTKISYYIKYFSHISSRQNNAVIVFDHT